MENKLMKEYMLNLLQNKKRLDERKPDEYRKDITVEYGISKKAEGSARVKIGKTEVLAGVKMEVGTPYPDAPDEGTLIVNSELSPMASEEFELGPPGIESIELARIIDRGIRESKAIDFKKLCIKKGEKIWMVLVDIYPINDDGNLFDAGALAAVAALSKAKIPFYDGEKIDYTKPLTGALPINELPISCTVGKIGNSFLIDPIKEESEVLDARLTVAMVKDGTIHAMQKGGETPLSIKDIDEMIKLATEKTKHLRKIVLP